jgi:hypothetical protein
MGIVALVLATATPAMPSVTSNLKVPLNLFRFVPCAADGAGEIVELAGTLHILTSVNVDSTGGVHMTTHFQPQGVGGVGLTTGDRYRGTGVTRTTSNERSAGLPASSTFVNIVRVIGEGPGNNFDLHQTVHVTVNANGDVTADVSGSRTTCR